MTSPFLGKPEGLRYVRGERFSLHMADLNAAGSLYVLGGLIGATRAVTDRPRRLLWLAALIVGAALLAAAAAAALVGKGRLQKATPPVPEETVDSIKTDVEEIKERARR